ncbi:hypothetical protein GOBAR_AA02360 [Gossypium barbadense]|uniref:Uncharacterized protein n=1 Tax=Gossypium barbadense TaxID=3634 RepID=A0A2P5YRK4_GOSBA|nr:hypothetical protein GOBAR_AA02360 [Gossypium barbadense]
MCPEKKIECRQYAQSSFCGTLHSPINTPTSGTAHKLISAASSGQLCTLNQPPSHRPPLLHYSTLNQH